MTVAEVAKQLRLSPACVYALCAEGKIPHYRLGLGRGTIRITPEQLQSYLDGPRAVPAGAAPVSLRDIKPPSSARS